MTTHRRRLTAVALALACTGAAGLCAAPAQAFPIPVYDPCSKVATTLNVVRGTSAAETIHGTSGADLICGYEGQDTIYGEGGDDVIWGGPQSDVLFGGPGADTIYGEDGADELRGGDGLDVMVGGPGIDTAWTGAWVGPYDYDVWYGRDAVSAADWSSTTGWGDYIHLENNGTGITWGYDVIVDPAAKGCCAHWY